MHEKTVVVAFATTETIEIAVESHARDYDKVDVALVWFSHRLEDVEVANYPLSVGSDFDRDDIVAFDSRENYAFARCECAVKERTHVDLVPKRVVEHYDRGLLVLSVGFNQFSYR